MRRELTGLRRQLDIRNVLKVGSLVANLVRVPQDGRHDALAERLEEHDALSSGDDHPGYRCLTLLAHRVADDSERLNPDRVFGRDVVGNLEVAGVDLLAGNEAADLDRVCALDLDRLKLLVLDMDEGAFPDLKALDLVVALDGRLGGRVDVLPLDLRPRLPVERMESDAAGGTRRWVKRNLAGDER